MKKNALMAVLGMVSLVAAILLAACEGDNGGLTTIITDSGTVSEAGTQTDAGYDAGASNVKSCNEAGCWPGYSCNAISGVCEETRDAGVVSPDAGQQGCAYKGCPEGYTCTQYGCLANSSLDAGTPDVGTPDAGQTCVPSVEICDGKDNDCDGQVDEGLDGCEGPISDDDFNKVSCIVMCDSRGWDDATYTNKECLCSKKLNGTSCLVAKFNGTTPSIPAEICDNKDNDCDGQTDEDFQQKGNLCSVGVGECKRTSTFVCTSDGQGLLCNTVAGPASAELCDGKDNDCDGLTDEDNVCPLPDAGQSDVGTPDTGTPDTGMPDVGVDAGYDAGQPDTGTADAGYDAGTVDSGASDSGTSDAGPVCTLLDGGSPGTATWRLTFQTQGGVTAATITVRSCNSSLYLTFNNTSSVEVTFTQDKGFTSCFQVDVDINGDGIMNFGAGDRWLCNYWQGTSRLDGEVHLFNPCNQELTVQVIETSGASNCRAQ